VNQTFFNDPGGIHYNDFFTELGYYAEVVGYEHDTHSGVGLQFADKIENLCLNGYVKRSGWFVGNQ